MADTFVERVTGQVAADAVPVTVNLVMSDESLLAAGHEPAVLDGAHPVPAQLARELVARAMDLPAGSEPGEGQRVGAWVRRLYADAGGNLVAMDSRSRTFPRGLAALLRVRDQGLCAGCNFTKQAPGWVQYSPDPRGSQGAPDPVAPEVPSRHTTVTTTPTDHTYRSAAPPLPAPRRAARVFPEVPDRLRQDGRDRTVGRLSEGAGQ